jgi:hypothetical protein
MDGLIMNNCKRAAAEGMDGMIMSSCKRYGWSDHEQLQKGWKIGDLGWFLEVRK